MPIGVAYRPAIVTTAAAQVDLDGWASGQIPPGVVDGQGTLWLLQNFEGWWAGPLPRTNFAPIPGNHGAFDARAYLDARVLTLEGTAAAVSLSAARRARDILASVCGDPSLTATLVVTEPGQPQRQCVVRRSGETKTKPLDPLHFAWSMLLTAPDPRRYAVALSSQSTGLAQPGAGGLVFPLVFPLTFGTGTSGGAMTLTNTGTLQTWPTWTILGPTTGPIITNLVTGERLVFDPAFPLGAGESVVIDTAAKTVQQAGTNRRNNLFVANWFALNPGTTQVLFSGGSNPAAQLTASWRDAWT